MIDSADGRLAKRDRCTGGDDRGVVRQQTVFGIGARRREKELLDDGVRALRSIALCTIADQPLRTLSAVAVLGCCCLGCCRRRRQCGSPYLERAAEANKLQ